MTLVKRIILWAATIFTWMVALTSISMALTDPEYRDNPSAAVTAAIICLGAAIGLSVWLYKVHRKTPTPQTTQTPTNNQTVTTHEATTAPLPTPTPSQAQEISRASKYGKLLNINLKSTNNYTHAGGILFLVFVGLIGLLIAVPLVAIFLQASNTEGTSNGAGVIASYILTPAFALMIAGWAALPALALHTIGLIQAKGKLRPAEYYTLFSSLLAVALSIISIRALPSILEFYQGIFSF
jgi:hypothetical protein